MFLMLTNVLMKPDWINRACNEKIYVSLVCQLTYRKKNQAQPYLRNLTNQDIQPCGNNSLYVENNCIYFLSDGNIFRTLDEKNKQHSGINRKSNNIIKILMEYFTILQHYYTNPLHFILQHNSDHEIFTPFQTEYFEQLVWKSKNYEGKLNTCNGFIVSALSSIKMKVHSTLFQCNDGSYILENTWCDMVKDCPDGSDENSCDCKSELDLLSKNSFCKYFCDKSNSCTCSEHFFTCPSSFRCLPFSMVGDGQFDCSRGEDEFTLKFNYDTKYDLQNKLSHYNSIKSFTQFNQYTKIHKDEEHTVLMVLYKNQHYSSYNNTVFLCLPRIDVYFPLNRLCILEYTNNKTELKYCSNGAHLYNCRHLQCAAYFKCPLDYCIPFHYICNGIWDCPNGDDELTCSSFACPNLFKCKYQTKCLHLAKVCDDIIDCEIGDDEFLCHFSQFSCPTGCVCFLGSVVCMYLDDLPISHAHFVLKHFKCYSCNIKFDLIYKTSFNSIKYVDLKGYQYSTLCVNKDRHQISLPYLQQLDISDNKLSHLKSFCFFGLANLQLIQLHKNYISNVEEYSFHSLINILVLDLSNNKLTTLTAATFIGIDNIVVLNLISNPLTFISMDSFAYIPKNTVYSFNIKICCAAGSWAMCKVEDNAFSNCDDLLSNPIVRFICWLIGIFGVFLNVNALIINMKFTKNMLSNTLLTFCLVIADSCFAVCLLATALADSHYRGTFIGYELSWRSSLWCKMSSFLALLSMTTSPLILCLMMVSRYCVIQWPMTSRFLHKPFYKLTTAITLFIAVSPCIFLVVIHYGMFEENVPTNVCLLIFTSPEQQSPVLFLTTVLTVLIQLLSSLVVLISGFLLLSTLIKNEMLKSSSTRKLKTNEITMHISILTFTNLCCWIPSSVFFTFPFFGHSVAHSTLAWITIGVVPINSALDPMFFTFLSPQVRKIGNRYLHNFRISFTRQNTKQSDTGPSK